jgi:drug/metabolite transporter (DMT)-like permease
MAAKLMLTSQVTGFAHGVLAAIVVSIATLPLRPSGDESSHLYAIIHARGELQYAILVIGFGSIGALLAERRKEGHHPRSPISAIVLCILPSVFGVINWAWGRQQTKIHVMLARDSASSWPIDIVELERLGNRISLDPLILAAFVTIPLVWLAFTGGRSSSPSRE